MNLGQSLTQTAQGAATGGQLTGSPIGAFAGGAIGLTTSLFGSDPNEQANKVLRDWTNRVNQATTTYTNAQGQILDQYGNLYTPEEVAATKTGYTNALTSSDPSQYSVDASKYTQTYTDPLTTWKKYLDPSIEYQQESARKNIEESAAGRGGLYSGEAANEIAQSVADNASTGYTNAYNMGRQANQDINTINSNNFAQNMQAGNYNLGLDQTNISNLGKAYDVNQGLMDTELSGRSDLNKTAFDTATGLANTRLSAKLGGTGGATTWDQFINATKTANDAGMFDYLKSYFGQQ